MHLFKHFFKLLSRNRVGLIIYAVITVVMASMLILTASGQPGAKGSVEEESYDISYSDMDDSLLSRGLIDYLSENNNLTDYSSKNDTEISNIVFFAITDFHMDIPEGFEESVINGDTSNIITYQTAAGNDSYLTYSVDSRINSYLNAYRNYRELGYDENEAIDLARELVTTTSEVSVIANEDENTGTDKKELVVYNINQYFPYLILGMMTLGVGHTILITNKTEIMDRNAVSPVPAFLTKFINIIGLIIVGIIIWGIFLSFTYIYGGETEMVTKYGWIIALNSFVSMLTCCSIAALLTNLIKSSNTLSMVTNIIGLSMSFFCGVFVPLRFIGDNVLAFAKFLPFYWTVWVNSMLSPAISTFSFDMTNCWIGIGVELLFAAAIATIAIFVTSKRIIKA